MIQSPRNNNAKTKQPNQIKMKKAAMFLSKQNHHLSDTLLILRLPSAPDSGIEFIELRQTEYSSDIHSFVNFCDFSDLHKPRVRGILAGIFSSGDVSLATFFELESHVIPALRRNETITPINLNQENKKKVIKVWLDLQPESSVLLLSFGTSGCFYAAQVKEIATALERTGYRFLWAVHTPPAKGEIGFPNNYGNPEDVLPEEFRWPDQILFHVILRLPFDSVFRFKCVSKSWRDLIDSSYFNEMRHLIDRSNFLEYCRRSCHSNQPESHPDSKIITMVGTKIYIYNSIVKIRRKGYMAIIAKKLSSPHMEFKKRRLELVGSCNGILCLANHTTGDFVIWNPFIESSLHSNELTSPPHRFKREYWPCLQEAFGYDHLHDDYKLVMWYLNDAPRCDGNGSDLYELCVYSLKMNTWRIITDASELNLHASGGYLPEQCAFTNGAMHWIVNKFCGCPMFTNLILAFDLSTYEFRKIPSAPLPKTPGFIHMNLSVLNGSLCMSYTYTHSSPSYYSDRHSVDIWVMKEYGVESSWTKITCIDLPENHYLSLHRFKAVAYSEKRGKLLLQPIFWRNPFIYDLKTKSLKLVAVGMRRKVRGFGGCQSSVCVGSFVSPCLLQ